MLARPEQDERRLDTGLVMSARGVAHAAEKAAASFGVAYVRLRHRPAVYEGVSECDVPGLESLDFALEVLATTLESSPSICHAPE